VIVGSGVDLMEVSRFEREVSRRGDALIEELFSAGERAWCRRRRRPAEGHAMVFAAKEALVKALGTGLVGRMNWRDIELTWPEDSRRPALSLTGATAAVAGKLGVEDIHCDVAISQEYAAAWIVVSGRPTPPGVSSK
jgi:holo-[acyl-carrier protein] synthase